VKRLRSPIGSSFFLPARPASGERSTCRSIGLHAVMSRPLKRFGKTWSMPV